ncbi:gluconate 2-dehydrogenase subunit 3 family protein [Thalassotalea sp. 1_MG-2023]|uniref:gluconate 2-dehydrogenase subunit 3 family protein n=1 Tax=Thalassotalea sp. 1_MG-2023 TaxID=3062680 RepID=UPI0026E37B66|nr:gluconate 2-dehydrogenase subunit 3 family protein [Thalassotalea sp. 1_MG-2023]MDO6427023.1 gluconate 2-dehydrogenase subunit 3 family protein [Thalassotalea sp. 1_MG-2023]
MTQKYQIKLSRRESLKWVGALSASTLIPNSVSALTMAAEKNTGQGHWPKLTLSPINAKGYGKDPNLLIPPKSPWPKTLTTEQLTLVAVLADIIVPREGTVPSGSEVGVPDVVDEWVSAPYSRQQHDRLTILSALTWIDDEAQLRFEQSFVNLTEQKRLQIIDDIAFEREDNDNAFMRIIPAFARFRSLVLAAFYSSPAGMKDIGYMGNVPIMGDYPGPTEEAMTHLEQVVKELGLTL